MTEEAEVVQVSGTQAFDGVAVEDGDNGAGEVSKRRIGKRKVIVASTYAPTAGRLFRQHFTATVRRLRERKAGCLLTPDILPCWGRSIS